METLDYLTYLAKLNTTHIHPFGKEATAVLINHLDLQPGQRVLEIGCGTGETMLMAAHNADVCIVGIDRLPMMLCMAQRRLNLAKPESATHIGQASAIALPFAPQTFDRVYMESVLGFQSITDAQTMLGQIRRVLKPGGIVVANEAIWKPETTDVEAAAIFAACMRDFGICQASEQAWDRNMWIRQMQAAGFDLLGSDLLTPEMMVSYPSATRSSQVIAVSQQMTQTYHKRKWFSPRLLLQTARYRRLMAQHRTDGRSIESRLFILAKSAGQL